MGTQGQGSVTDTPKGNLIERYRATLLAKKTELETALRDRVALHVEKHADPVDDVLAATSREMAITFANRETGLLREVMAALQRIDNGSYGFCIDCGEEMLLKRILAVPWAPRCTGC